MVPLVLDEIIGRCAESMCTRSLARVTNTFFHSQDTYVKLSKDCCTHVRAAIELSYQPGLLDGILLPTLAKQSKSALPGATVYVHFAIQWLGLLSVGFHHNIHATQQVVDRQIKTRALHVIARTLASPGEQFKPR